MAFVDNTSAGYGVLTFDKYSAAAIASLPLSFTTARILSSIPRSDKRSERAVPTRFPTPVPGSMYGKSMTQDNSRPSEESIQCAVTGYSPCNLGLLHPSKVRLIFDKRVPKYWTNMLRRHNVDTSRRNARSSETVCGSERPMTYRTIAASLRATILAGTDSVSVVWRDFLAVGSPPSTMECFSCRCLMTVPVDVERAHVSGQWLHCRIFHYLLRANVAGGILPPGATDGVYVEWPGRQMH